MELTKKERQIFCYECEKDLTDDEITAHQETLEYYNFWICDDCSYKNHERVKNEF